MVMHWRYGLLGFMFMMVLAPAAAWKMRAPARWPANPAALVTFGLEMAAVLLDNSDVVVMCEILVIENQIAGGEMGVF